MLASLVQSSRALSFRPLSGAPHRFLNKRSCFGTLGPGEPPLANRPQHQVRAFGAPPSGVKHDLKAQILSEADNVTFRYEIDNHKFQSEAVIKQAEKAIGVGDAVLQLVITEGLLSRYPAASLGGKADLRSSMINRAACFKYAKMLRLGKWLIVGNAVELFLHPGDQYPYPSSIMSELFEAVLGAIYLDGGLVQSHAWFTQKIGWPATFEAAVKQYK